MKTVNILHFLDEFELLRLRLDLLKNYVDQFVIIEADTTFSGISKPLFFKDAKKYGFDFSSDNIIHVPITNMPFGNDPWARETHQRNHAIEYVEKLKPDLVLMTDSDEIPTPAAIEMCHILEQGKFSFHMDFLKFYVNMQQTGEKWDGKSMAYKPALIDPAAFDRGNQEGDYHIKNAGWHFDYMGGRDRLLYKINATSHFNEIGGRTFWQEIYNGTHDFSYCSPYDTNLLPREAQFLISDPRFCLHSPEQDWRYQWQRLK